MRYFIIKLQSTIEAIIERNIIKNDRNLLGTQLSNRSSDIVIPYSQAELTILKYTLKPEDASYVQLDENGHISKDIINSHESSDHNFLALKELVNSKNTYEIIIDDTYRYKLDNKIIENKFPEVYDIFSVEGYKPQGHTGISLSPEDKRYGSTDRNFKVFLNKNNESKVNPLPNALAHELYGHALLHSRGEKWMHEPEDINGGKKDMNTSLKKNIARSTAAAKRNMKEWQKYFFWLD